MRRLRLLVVVLGIALVGSTLAAAPLQAQAESATNCTGTRSGQEVTLSFDGTIGSSVQLLRDGRWQQEVTDLSTVTDRSPVGTTYDLRIREGGISLDEPCTISETGTADDGQATCTIVEGDPNVLEFTGDLGNTVQLRRNGSWVANVTGRASYELPNTGTDGYIIRISGGRYDGRTECSTNPQPLAVDAAVCAYARDGAQVELSFDGSLSSSVQLRRDGRWLSDVTDETTFSDSSVVGTLYVLRVDTGGAQTDYRCAGTTFAEPTGTGAAYCVFNADGTLLTFGGDLGNSADLRRFGDWVATVTADSTVATDGTDGYVLRVRGGTHPGEVACVADAASAPSTGSIAWVACAQDFQVDFWPDDFAAEFGGPVRFECGSLDVPLDYDEPNGDTINLPLVRVPALDPANRIGSLFTNPGGPGGSGIDFVLFSGPIAFGPAVRAQFDIVGFDPRGVVRSEGAQCFSDVEAALDVLSPFPFPLNDAEQAEFIAADAAVSAACDAAQQEIFSHMSTANVARDLDALREAVGDEQLTYAGFSYGTQLGANYANLFPDNIRALMLDSALDPVAWTTGAPGQENVPVTTRIGSHVGGEATLEDFFRLCDAAGPELCPIAPGAEARWDAVFDRLAVEPIDMPMPVFDELGNVIGEEPFLFGASDFVAQTNGLLFSADFSPVIAIIVSDIEQIINGDVGPNFRARFASDVQLLTAGEANSFTERLGFDPFEPVYENFTESFAGVLCADSQNPSNIDAWPTTVDALEDDYRFAAFWTWSSSICNQWTPVDEDRYLGPWDAQTSNTILIMSNQFDPSTPLEGAIALNNVLADSALLVVDGGRGHIAAQSSSCAAAAADFYLVTTEIPADLTCQPDNNDPFELLAPPDLFVVVLPDGTEAAVVLVEGPTEDLPVALDPETGEPLNIDLETGEVLPITILGPV